VPKVERFFLAGIEPNELPRIVFYIPRFVGFSVERFSHARYDTRIDCLVWSDFGAIFGAKRFLETRLTNENIDALVAQLDRARLS